MSDDEEIVNLSSMSSADRIAREDAVNLDRAMAEATEILRRVKLDTTTRHETSTILLQFRRKARTRIASQAASPTNQSGSYINSLRPYGLYVSLACDWVRDNMRMTHNSRIRSDDALSAAATLGFRPVSAEWGRYAEVPALVYQFASRAERESAYTILLDTMTNDAMDIDFMRSRQHVRYGGERSSTKLERVKFSLVAATTPINALTAMTGIIADISGRPQHLIHERATLHEVQAHTDSAHPGTFSVYITFRTRLYAENVVRAFHNVTRQSPLYLQGVQKGSPDLGSTARILAAHSDGTGAGCRRCSSLAHSADVCDIYTIRVEDYRDPLNVMKRKAVAQMAYADVSEISNGNDWHGMQHPKRWFLFHVPEQHLHKALTVLEELAEIQVITAWDVGEDNDQGHLESCNSCGTMRANCSSAGSIQWHHSHEKTKCPRNRDAGAAARTGLWWGNRKANFSPSLMTSASPTTHTGGYAGFASPSRQRRPERKHAPRTPARYCEGTLVDGRNCTVDVTTNITPFCKRHAARASPSAGTNGDTTIYPSAHPQRPATVPTRGPADPNMAAPTPAAAATGINDNASPAPQASSAVAPVVPALADLKGYQPSGASRLNNTDPNPFDPADFDPHDRSSPPTRLLDVRDIDGRTEILASWGESREPLWLDLGSECLATFADIETIVFGLIDHRQQSSARDRRALARKTLG